MKQLGRACERCGGALWRSRQLDADMQDEMRLHIEMEAERLARDAGTRSARRRGGRRTSASAASRNYKEEGARRAGFALARRVSLDARLGVRMLVKHRWLTLVGGLAMAVAIAIGATAFEVISVLLNPALPFPDGDRVVARQVRDDEYRECGRSRPARLRRMARPGHDASSTSAHSATVQHNLVAPNAPPEPIYVAEITASAFAIAQTPPLLGRYLLPSDEAAEGAPPVVVIGHDAWRTRFGADPVASSDAPSQLGGVRTRSSGSCRQASRSRSTISSGFRLRLDPLEVRGPWEGRRSASVRAADAEAPRSRQAQAELATTWPPRRRCHPDGTDGCARGAAVHARTVSI